MKILECSTKGDKRFSALHAKVSVSNKIDTIENWYQLSKSFNDVRPKDYKEAKYLQHRGHEVTSIFIGGKELPPVFLTQWYTILWLGYLDSNPDLVAYASTFDDFTDSFCTPDTINNQANIIKAYIKDRRSLVNSSIGLIDILFPNKVPQI